MTELFPLVHNKCSFDDLKIDMDELFTLTGYGSHRPEGYVLEFIDEILVEMRECSSPEYGYAILPGKYGGDKVFLDDATVTTGRIIASAVRESEYFAVFLATVGPGIDACIKRFQKEDEMVKAFLADGLGSVLAEACASLMLERLSEEMSAHGFHISNSYSPGYCDWYLKDQKVLFSFFPEKFCGIELTPSCLMLPVKSVSGIVGIGKNVKKRLYACDICKMTNCVKNRKKAMV